MSCPPCGIAAAVTQHGIGDVHEVLLLETRHGFNAEAQCELDLRSDSSSLSTSRMNYNLLRPLLDRRLLGA